MLLFAVVAAADEFTHLRFEIPWSRRRSNGRQKKPIPTHHVIVTQAPGEPAKLSLVASFEFGIWHYSGVWYGNKYYGLRDVY